MFENSVNNTMLTEKKLSDTRPHPEWDFQCDNELTVHITLAEYRALLESKCDAFRYCSEVIGLRRENEALKERIKSLEDSISAAEGALGNEKKNTAV